MESLLHKKTIQRAIASELVNDTSNVISLIQQYDSSITNDITYNDLLELVLYLLDTNDDFKQKFFDLLINNKQILDYHNAAGIVSSIANVVSGFINIGTTNKQMNIQQQQLNAENTQSIMNYMMQEEENRLAKQQSENNIIYLAIGGMVLIVGIIIFKKK